jgi:hypothetical protein
MRQMIGLGTPRGLQGRLPATIAMLAVLLASVRRRFVTITTSFRVIAAMRGWPRSATTINVNSSAPATCTTGS